MCAEKENVDEMRQKSRKDTEKDWRPTIEQCEKILRTLVQVNTCQPEGNESILTGWIVNQIRKQKESAVTVIPFEHSKNRSSLIIKLKGRKKEGGLAFVGHLDTVACGNMSKWDYQPHMGVTKKGCMFGRGTADMKGGDAAMLLVLEKLLEEQTIPEEPIYFCFTADEENQGIGIQAIEKSGELNTIREMIICEPSNEQISICEKGAVWLRIFVTGHGAHASRPDLGINAIDLSYQFAMEMQRYLMEEPEHPILLRSTASVTRISGGIMTNMIPASAEMEMDIRTVPGIQYEDIMKMAEKVKNKLETNHLGVGITYQVLNYRPAIGTKKESVFLKKIINIAEKFEISTIPRGTFFYTDASQIIPQLSIPFVIAGPGDDSLAHCTNEYIELDSVARFAGLYYQYILGEIC